MYLACAYGQQYAYLQADPHQDEHALKNDRDKALEAVQRVLQINPNARGFLRGLWDRDRAQPDENDLTVFYDDPDFQRILGEAAPGQ
jgi:hypothetical protein